jgi:hypothetical protein
LGLGTELGLNVTWKFGLDQIRYYNIVNYCIIKCIFTGLVFLVCQSEFCPGLWIKSCGLVNYCTIRSIVKIKMVLKVVFGTFRPIVNRKKRAMYKVGTARDAEKRAAGGRQLLVPGHLRASWFNRHPQMRLTPGHPESTHCQECFRNPPSLHAPAVQDLRQSLEQQF